MKRGLFFFSFFLPLFAFGSLFQSKGEAYFLQKDWPKAEAYYLEKLKKAPNDWKLHFNLGTIQYKETQWDVAEKKFKEALALCQNPDKQECIFYNLSNVLFRKAEKLPEENPQEIETKIKSLEESLKGYESALELNSKSIDTRHNHAFVKKRIEELRQKLKQQQEQKNQSPESKESKSKQTPNASNSSQNDSKSPSQPSSNSASSSENGSRLPSNPEKNQGSEEKSEQPPPQVPREKDKGFKGKANGDRRQEMQSLLNASKGEEKVLPVLLMNGSETERIKEEPVLKDW